MSSTASAAGTAASSAFRRLRNPYWAAMQKFRTKDRVYRREIARAQGATDHLGKPIFTPFTWNIVKGDLVQVTQPSLVRDPQSGRALQNKYGQTMAEKWNGQQGEVLKVIRKHEQVIVKGVNLTKRVVRPTDHSRGFTFEAESPIPYARVSLLDPSTGQPVIGGIKRVKREDGGGTERYVKATGALIPKPVGDWKVRAMKLVNPRTDTKPADVLAETYVKPDYTDRAKVVVPQVQLDAQGKPVTVEEQIPLSHEERVRLLKKLKRTPAEQAKLEAGFTTHTTTVLLPEDKELRAARIKF